MSEIKNELKQLHEVLYVLVGHYRRLLEIVRLEKDALIESNLNSVQGITHSKEAQIEMIKQSETKRRQITTQLSIYFKVPLKDLTLNQIILRAQDIDQVVSETLRSDLSTLTLLMERTADQNAKNKEICLRSLKTIGQMKKNVLGEAEPKNETYSKTAQKVNATGGGRLISGEA